MIYAQVSNGIVTNIIEADQAFAASIGAVPAEAGGTVAVKGGTWDGETFGPAVEPQEAPEQIADRLEMAVQRHLDQTAQSRGYDHILSLCSYATSTNARYQAEGLAGMDWRDAVWSASETIQNAVLQGQRAVPTEAELIAELPAIQWPA